MPLPLPVLLTGTPSSTPDQTLQPTSMQMAHGSSPRRLLLSKGSKASSRMVLGCST